MISPSTATDPDAVAAFEGRAARTAHAAGSPPEGPEAQGGAHVFCERSLAHYASVRYPPMRGVPGGVQSARRLAEGCALRGSRFAWAHGLGAEAGARLLAGGSAGPDALPAPTPCPAEPALAALLTDLLDATLALAPADVRAVEVRYAAQQRRVQVHRPAPVADFRTVWGLEVRVRTREAAGGAVCSGPGDEPSAEAAAALPARAVQRLRHAAAAARLPAEEGPPVVFTNACSGAYVHEALGHACEADAAGRLGLRLGDVLTHPSLRLLNDPTAPGAALRMACDDEGAPALRALLIEAGRLVGLLAGAAEAAAWGLPRAGAARCEDYRRPPLPRMTHLRLEGPDAAADPADLVRELRSGLVVSALGAGRIDPATGRFTLPLVEAHRVRGGALAEPVRGSLVGAFGAADIRAAAGPSLVAADHTACSKAGQTLPVTSAAPALLVGSLAYLPG